MNHNSVAPEHEMSAFYRLMLLFQIIYLYAFRKALSKLRTLMLVFRQAEDHFTAIRLYFSKGTGSIRLKSGETIERRWQDIWYRLFCIDRGIIIQFLENEILFFKDGMGILFPNDMIYIAWDDYDEYAVFAFSGKTVQMEVHWRASPVGKARKNHFSRN